MQAARLLIKLCIALAPLAAQAGGVKIKLHVEGWRPWFLLVLLAPPPVVPALAPNHLAAPPAPAEPGIVYVGGVQYRIPSSSLPLAPLPPRD